MEAQQLIAQQPEATASIVPTATIDFAATLGAAQAESNNARMEAEQAQREAIWYQQTAVASGVELAKITAEAEQMQVIYMQSTQSAEMIAITQTAEMFKATQTYQPTADSKFATQSVIAIGAQTQAAARMTEMAEEPERARVIAEAEDLQKNGWIMNPFPSAH